MSELAKEHLSLLPKAISTAIAPNVSIRGGNHSYHIIGKFITDYTISDKRVQDDQPVYVEDDVWMEAMWPY